MIDSFMHQQITDIIIINRLIKEIFNFQNNFEDMVKLDVCQQKLSVSSLTEIKVADLISVR